MRRLNETQLDARIHSFLERKFAEFPELDSESAVAAPAQSRASRRPKVRHFHPRIRWGTAL